LAIVRWSPTNDLAGLHSAMDRLFGDMFGELYTPARQGDGEAGGSASAEAQPQLPTYHLPVNIAETENGYRIEAPVPGFRPEDVEVTFADGTLTISARRQEERTSQEGNYLRREVAFGNYRRHITLPGDINADGIMASFDNGVLTVEVPRAPRPEPKRIQVQPGERQADGGDGGGGQSERQSELSGTRSEKR
jgi:HSP20 family protein